MNCFSYAIMAALWAASTGIAATFPQGFQAAARLRDAGRIAEAEAAFLELAGRGGRNPSGPDAALEQAILCALQRKDLEDAEARIGQIRDDALRTLCRMRILEAQRLWPALVTLAADQEFAAWPDRLIYGAAMCRGRARATQGDATAEEDFQQALAATFDPRERASASLALGTFYRDQARDEDKALAAYGEVAQSDVRGAIKFEGVIARALLLAQRGNAEEALAGLDQLGVEEIPYPDWRCRIHGVYGDVYTALNRPDEAAAAYGRAAAVSGASEYLVKAIEEKNRTKHKEIP